MHVVIPPLVDRRVREEREDRGRELHDGGGEDQGQHAAGVDLQRDVGGLAAVHLAADHALGVLHRHAALAKVDEGNAHDQNQEDDDDAEEAAQRELGNIDKQRVDVAADGAGKVGDDAGEDQEADAVADAVFGDALADPHGQRRAGGKAEADGDQAQRALRGSAKTRGERHGLEKAEADGDIAGDLRDLLAALFALLVQLLQLGDGDGEQLHDDRGVDVGRDAHGHDRVVGKVRAGHLVDEAQKREAFDRVLNHGGVNARGGDEAQHAVDQQHEQRVEDLLAQLGDLPGIFQRLKHIRSPRPSRLPPRSFPSRWR